MLTVVTVLPSVALKLPFSAIFWSMVSQLMFLTAALVRSPVVSMIPTVFVPSALFFRLGLLTISGRT